MRSQPWASAGCHSTIAPDFMAILDTTNHRQEGSAFLKNQIMSSDIQQLEFRDNFEKPNLVKLQKVMQECSSRSRGPWAAGNAHSLLSTDQGMKIQAHSFVMGMSHRTSHTKVKCVLPLTHKCLFQVTLLTKVKKWKYVLMLLLTPIGTFANIYLYLKNTLLTL